MAVDTKARRAASLHFGKPGIRYIVPDGAITVSDRYIMMFNYPIAGGSGTITFYNTTLGSGVASNVYDGVTIDDDGNLRARGAVYEADAT